MDIADIVRKAAEKSGFQRESFIAANLPTTLSNILVLPLFSDIRATCIASSLILKRYKESRINKYLILCSWPGHRALFPYVDEYWSPKEQSSLQALASHALGMHNQSDLLFGYNRSLNNFFESVLSSEAMCDFYENGFGPKYWSFYKDVKCFFPNIPSFTTLPDDFKNEMEQRKGFKLVVFPVKKMDSWQGGKLSRLTVHRDFWCALVDRLLLEGFLPIIYQNHFTYDLSSDFTTKCVWLSAVDIGQVLSGLRWADCVLDIHSGMSRMATAARTPCLIVDERIRYVESKNYELDDLTNLSPRQYLFSFSTMLMSGGVQDWNTSLLDGIVSRLNKWLPALETAACGSPTEINQIADYAQVRRHKAKRLGIHFLKKK